MGRLSELFSAVLCTTIVHTHMSSSYRCTRDCWFRFSLGYFVCFACFSYIGSVCLLNGYFLCSWCISFVCFELSVLVQVIAWKDSSLSDLLYVKLNYSLAH